MTSSWWFTLLYWALSISVAWMTYKEPERLGIGMFVFLTLIFVGLIAEG